MAAPMSSDSSSSDEDENIAQLREAAVDSSHFITATSNPLASSNGDLDEKGKFANIPSLRPDKELDPKDQEDRYLHTTPGFRKHVAKKLTAALDSDLDTSTKCFCPKEVTVKNNEGIRLFRGSRQNVTGEAPDVVIRRRKRPPSPSSDDSSEDEKLAEAAVSHDFVVQQSSLPYPANQKPPDVIIATTVADDKTKCFSEKTAFSRTENIVNESENKETITVETVNLDKSDKKKKKKKKKKKTSSDIDT